MTVPTFEQELIDSMEDFASLMVDEVIAKLRLQLEAGEPLTLNDQKVVIDQLIKERARIATARPPAPANKGDAA